MTKAAAAAVMAGLLVFGLLSMGCVFERNPPVIPPPTNAGQRFALGNATTANHALLDK